MIIKTSHAYPGISAVVVPVLSAQKALRREGHDAARVTTGCTPPR
jgi:hypothetical protein